MRWPPAHEGARRDFQEQVEYLRQNASKSAAALFVRKTMETVARARRFPASGSPLGEARRMPIRPFACDLVYLVEGDELYLVAIAHHRRHPEYWHDRL